MIDEECPAAWAGAGTDSHATGRHRCRFPPDHLGRHQCDCGRWSPRFGWR